MTNKLSKKRLSIMALVFIAGAVMSVLLHELVHVIVHWGHIVRIDVFPSNGNIMQVVAMVKHDYNHLPEELVAYGVTILVMALAAVVVVKIGTKK